MWLLTVPLYTAHIWEQSQLASSGKGQLELVGTVTLGSTGPTRVETRGMGRGLLEEESSREPHCEFGVELSFHSDIAQLCQDA